MTTFSQTVNSFYLNNDSGVQTKEHSTKTTITTVITITITITTTTTTINNHRDYSSITEHTFSLRDYSILVRDI